MSDLHHRPPTSGPICPNSAASDRCEDSEDPSRKLLARLRCSALWISFFCCAVACGWLATMKPVAAEGLDQRQTVDLSVLSCADLLRMPLPQALVVVGWIGGFYAGLKNDTIVHVLSFIDDADRIVDLCRNNGSSSVMTLVEQTFGLVRPPRAPSGP